MSFDFEYLLIPSPDLILLGKGQKSRKIYIYNIYTILIFFVPLLASATKEIVHPTHPTFLLLFFYYILYILYYYYRFFMETESVSEVSGPHDMGATEKK